MSTDSLDRTGTEGLGLDAEYLVTNEQLSSLYEQSWCFLPGLLNEEAVAALRARYRTSKAREYPGGDVQYGPNSAQLEFGEDDLVMHEGLAWSDPFMRELATSPRLGDLVLTLMKQPSAVLVHDMSFMKTPGAIPIPFHQDHSYHPHDRAGCLSFWIALVDIEENMGPLRYIEGSHLDGPLGYIDDADVRDVYPQLKDRKIVHGPTPIRAGDAQAHWNLTVHGSGPNDGDRTREAVALRYVRPDMVYTGLHHPHYDKFNLSPMVKFRDVEAFPRIERSS